MRLILILFLLCVISCKPLSKKDKLRNTLPGNWLVLSADHELAGGNQVLLYAHIQDSLVAAKCLKLLTFFDDSSFQQIDYPDIKGRWTISADKELTIAGGGKGFDDYQAKMTSSTNGIIELLEKVDVGGESFRVFWQLKKLKDDDLFRAKKNSWRKKATRPESEKEIRERLAEMLNYYADYYELIGREVTYFIPGRVLLPLKFYQHAMGVLPFDSTSDFAQLFFDPDQATQAYGYLKRKVYDMGNRFPDGEDYMEEYISFMRLVAKEIK